MFASTLNFRGYEIRSRRGLHQMTSKTKSHCLIARKSLKWSVFCGTTLLLYDSLAMLWICIHCMFLLLGRLILHMHRIVYCVVCVLYLIYLKNYWLKLSAYGVMVCCFMLYSKWRGSKLLNVRQKLKHTQRKA
jgi:hypothetical protein